MITVNLPHHYNPRPYQIPLLEAMDSGYLRAIQVWHRRAGKEKTDFAGLVVPKMFERIGEYYYVFPELAQGRKVIWDGTDREGFKLLDHIPRELIVSKNDTEMKVKVKGGSLLQVIGSDRFDSTMGTNPKGIVFSEYALQDPRCWGFYRPILAENGGWAVFNFTPRGENHAKDLLDLAEDDPKHWHVDIKTVDDTGAIPKDVLDQERKEIMRLYGSDALFLQEYYCDFNVPISGAYYAVHISRAIRDGRIGQVPYEPKLLVDTYWDLGVNDRMAIWFVQQNGAEIRLIDYMEGSDQGLDYYIPLVLQKPYRFGKHVAPHDIEVRELTNGRSRRDTAASMGMRFRVAPKLDVEDGIDAVRNIFDRCWFDKVACKDGINALKSYHKAFDAKRRTYANHPYHDWSSNGADAFRYMATSIPGSYGKPAASMSAGNMFSQPKTLPEWAR